MKYKEQPPKRNRIMMAFMIPLLVFLCVCWLLLKNYIRFGIYTFLTILILYLFFFTYYYIEKNYLIIKAGIIKLKIKYENIEEVIQFKEKVIIKLKSINFTLYPDSIKDFNKELKDKVNKRVKFTEGDPS